MVVDKRFHPNLRWIHLIIQLKSQVLLSEKPHEKVTRCAACVARYAPVEIPVMATAAVGGKRRGFWWLQVPRGFGYPDYVKNVRLRHVMFVDMFEKFVMWKIYLQKLIA